MYKKRTKPWLKHLDFEILDILFEEFALLLIVYFGSFYPTISGMLGNFMLALLAAHIFNVFAFNFYNNIVQRGYFLEAIAVFKIVFADMVISILLLYMIHQSERLSRRMLLLTAIIAYIFVFIEHSVNKIYVRQKVATNPKSKSMLVIGNSEDVEFLVSELMAKKYRYYRINAIAALGNVKKHNFKVPTLYSEQEVMDYLTKNVVDEVYIDKRIADDKLNVLIEQILETGVVVHVGLGIITSNLPNPQLSRFHDLQSITCTIALADSWKLFIKRVADIVGAIIGLAITILVSIVLVPAIKITDPGPAFFSQDRVGKSGRIFKIYKFRSMYMDAEQRKAELMKNNVMDGFMFKVENDPDRKSVV